MIRLEWLYGKLLLLLAAVVAAGLMAIPQAALAAGGPGMVYVPLLSGHQSVAAANDDPGAVYVLTNQPTGNGVAIFQRAADGTLTLGDTVATGGLGTGAGLGSQGALALSENGRWLLAVNPGSDELSALRVQPDGLVLTDKVASGGIHPTSVTIHKRMVYVLNAGGSGNITGFRLDETGHLIPLADSTRFLSNNGVGDAPAPAQVSFNPAGTVLVVTERATHMIDTYSVDEQGLATGPAVHASSGSTPFGFGFAGKQTLVVSEAFPGVVNGSAVSSYRVTKDGFSLVSGSVPTGQTAACWVAVTKNGKFAYSANAGSSSVSAYRVRDGGLTLLDGDAGLTGAGTAPIDMSISHNSRYLYVLSSRTQSVVTFAIQADGSLAALGSVDGLPSGSAGVAAW
jgi:6-phosphogluconolactonase (cycloisomerase 2 family)